MPNAAYALLLTLAGSLAVAAPSSAARLLIAGGQGDPPGAGAFDVRCLLVPTTADWWVHVLTYGLLVAVLAGNLAGGRAFFSEWCRTRSFLGRFLTDRTEPGEALERLARQVGLAGRIDLVVANEPRCFCYGLARPRVCVTTGLLVMLTGSELEAVLRHEAYHVRNYDPLKLIVGRALVAAFFFLPALRDLFGHYRLHVELVADKEAVRRMREVQSLASALDKLLDVRATGPLALPGIAHTSSLEARIDSLLGEPVRASAGTRPRRLALSVLIVLLVAAPAVAALATGERALLAALASTPHPAC